MEAINISRELLHAALRGYERDMDDIQKKVNYIRTCLDDFQTPQSRPAPLGLAIACGVRRRRQMSPETKARIAASQRARWQRRRSVDSNIGPFEQVSRVS